MGAVNYYGALSALKDILEADARVADARVYIEEDPQFDMMGAGRALVLTLESRGLAANQPLAAGKRVRWNVRIAVWAVGFGMSFEQASKVRDDLVGQLELVLMDNRTLSGVVAAGQLNGGTFVSVRSEQGIFVSMAETVFEAEALAYNA